MKTEYLIIIGLALVVFYLSTCNKPQTIHTETTVRFTDTITEVDTLVKEIVRDHYNIREIHDTITIKAIPLGLDTFSYPIKDSLLNGTILAFSKERPFINFDYKLKQFEIKESITIKDSVYHERVKSYLSAGVMLTGSQSSFGFAPQLQYNHKTGINVGIGYDIINRNYHLGFTKRISLK
jgi:hypothetical protein